MARTEQERAAIRQSARAEVRKFAASGSSVDAAYVDSFLTDANAYIEKLNADSGSLGYSNASSIYNDHANQFLDLRNRSAEALAFLDRNRGSMDEGKYQQMRSQVESFRKGLTAKLAQLSQAQRQYSQFTTEADYNRATQHSGWIEKYRNKSYGELERILQGMEDGEEKQWLTDYAGQVDYKERSTLDLEKANKEVQELDALLKNAEYLEEQYNAFLNNGLLMLTQGDAWRDIQKRYDAIQEKHGSVENIRKTLAQKRQYMAESKQLQDGIKVQTDHEAWVQTVRDSSTIQKELDALKKRMVGSEAKSKQEKWNSVLGNAAAGMAATSSGLAPQAQKLVTDPELTALKEKQAALEKELWYSRMQEYAALMNNADFTEKSIYIPTANAVGKKTPGEYVTGDNKYDYINKNQQTVMEQTLNEQRSGAALVGMGMSWLQTMTDEEVAVYNYLHATKGKDKADEFIAFLRPDLTARQRQGMENTLGELSRENPYLMSAISVGLSPMRGISLIGQAADYMTDGKIDQNAGYNKFSYVPAAVRNEVTQTIQQNEKWGAAGSFAYQTAMSMGDFLINAGVGNGISGVATAIMGSGAAADTVIRHKDRGLSDGQAFSLGIVAGLAEAMTERFSLEALLNPNLLKSGIGVYMLTNSLTEGSEEVASSIINLAADILVTKEKSEWQETIRKFQDQGYSEGEAYGKALAEQAASLGMDFLGGALSGGIMSGVTSAQYYASTKRDGRAMGRRSLTDSQEVQQILDVGHNAGKDTAAHAVAGRLQKKVDEGRKLSAFDKGQLYQSNPQVVGEAAYGKGSVQLATPFTQGIDNQDERWKQAQRLSAITGRAIKFYNGAENENGYFDKRTGEIFVNTNAADTVAQVVSHELTHSTELAESYKDLVRFVRGKLRAEGKSWEQMVQGKSEAYAAQGHPLETDSDAEAEIIAEYVQNYLLTNEQEIYEVVWESPTLGQRILNWIDNILVKLNNQKAKERQMLHQAREIYAKAVEQSQSRQTNKGEQRKNEAEPDGNLQGQYSSEDMNRMDEMYRDLFDRGEITEEEYDEYLSWRDHETAAGEGEAELGRQFSLATLDAEYTDRQNYIDADISAEEVETGFQAVAAMEPVAHITGDEFAKGEVDLITQVERFFTQKNNEAYNPQLGTVILDRKGVKSDIGHGIGRKKAAAFAAVPDIIEKGQVVDYQKNWKGRGYDTAVIAAPIRIGEEEYIAAVIAIRSRKTNLFYVHEVMTTKNGAMPFKTGARKSGDPSGDAPSIFSILNRLVEVKKNRVNSSQEKQFSIVGSATMNKRDIARDLRAILSRGGDPRELQRYVSSLEQPGRNAEQNRENRYQNGEERYKTGENRNSTAQEILEAAHSQGMGVDEYLRWNPEQFEVDGKWRSEALEAIRMEQGGRQYSLTGEPEAEADAPEEPDSQAGGIRRENLSTKARNYLYRTESRLLNSIGEALSIPRYARYNSLQSVIQEISDTYLAEGRIPEDKWDELFDKAYAEGIVADSAFYEQYKEIKDHLRTYGVTLSEQDRSDIADFNDFRKRAFGTLRILNDGGVPVDVAYQELQGMAPELFPDNITHPADQLVRMFDVGRSIDVSKKSLDEYYGPEKDEFRKWARNDFDCAVGDAFRDLRQVKRYAEDQAQREEVKQILTVEEAEDAFEELKKLRRNVEKVQAKNLLTEDDKLELGRLLKGEISLEHLDSNRNNVKGITALYEVKLAYESQCEVLAVWKRSVKAKRLQQADNFLEDARAWKDKRAGILYARETMRRNIMDIIPDRKLAEQVAEFYFESVHISEAKATNFKTEYRDKVRELNLSTKVIRGNVVSEAHAVQLLGEAMDNIRVIEKSRGRISMRDGKTLQEWRAVVDDLWMNNPGLDRQKIEGAVEVFRKIYDELFQKMNRVRVENGYEPVNYRQGYFPHFQPGGDGIMAFFGKVMGINTQVDALPTTINGLTHTFKPGIQWFGNAQERLGFNTAYDAVEGFDKYIEGVASVIFQTENIQNLRALATQVRYRTSDEGIRKQVDAVRMDSRLTDEEKQREINAIYEHGKFSLSNFVAELDEYTNLLANKKSKYDRSMEHLIGRRAYTLMKAWENRVGANMIAGNISSALTNFIPLTQAGAQMDSGMILRGMWDTLRNIRSGDGFAGTSDFLTNRRGSDVLVKNWVQKTSGWLGTPMELIDNFTSESIVRAAYLQNRKRGLSEAEAMHQADIFASSVMADRSKGAMPTLFESRNPLFKAFSQFQLEVNNQFSEVFKDLPRNHREKGLMVLAGILLKYFLGAWMYNELFEKIIGRRSALDPIGILMEAGEDLTGYEIPNLFDMVIGGDRIEKTGEGSIGDAGANLATNILSNLPFSAGLTLFGVETDGGRLPAASAVPDLSALWDAATEKGWTKEQRWDAVQKELNKLAYVIPPFGGGQISKSWKGVDAYLQGGSYGRNQKGEEILQYPVYKDDPDDAFWSLVRAAFLGKNSLPEAQDWVREGYNSLNALETAVYRDMLDVGIQDRTAYGIIDSLRNVEDTEAGAKRAEQRRILARSNLSTEGKAVAYYGMVATDKEQKWMNALADAGADQADAMVFVSNLYDAQNLKGTEKKEEQLRVFLDSENLTEEEKIVAAGFVLGTDLEYDNGNPTQYAKFLAAMETGLTVDEYMEIRAAGADIEDYLELADAGVKGERAAGIVISIEELELADGAENVSWIQKCYAITESDLSEAEQMAALNTVMNASTYEKVEVGHNFGMNVKSYIDLKNLMPQFDQNGNGSYSQQETEDAINALSGDDNPLFALTGTTPNGYTLTDREKAILWQLQNKSWKPSRNPFDKEVGQMIYDILTAEDVEK